MKAIILADLHIEAKSRWSETEENEDLEFLIKQLKELPEDTFDVDCIIVAGDTTDRPRENATVLKNLAKLFKAVNPLDKPVYVINGNHDTGADNYLSTICNSVRVEEGIVQIADKKVAFLDYNNNLDYVRDFLKQEEPDIFVIHQSSKPFIQVDIEDLPVMKIEDYPVGKICIVGDTHIPDICTDDDRFILSPGSLYPHNKTELLSVDNFLITMDTDYPTGLINATPLKSRTGIALESSKSLEMIKDSVESFLASESPLKPVIWLPDYAKDLAVNDTRAVFRYFNTFKDSEGVVTTIEDNTDIEAIIKQFVDELDTDDKTKEAVYTLVKQFADAEDPKDVILE